MYSSKLLLQLVYTYSQSGLIVDCLLSPGVLYIGQESLHCDLDGMESINGQEACTGSAKEVPCKKLDVRGINRYPTSDQNADCAEVGGKMNKETQV